MITSRGQTILRSQYVDNGSPSILSNVVSNDSMTTNGLRKNTTQKQSVIGNLSENIGELDQHNDTFVDIGKFIYFNSIAYFVNMFKYIFCIE